MSGDSREASSSASTTSVPTQLTYLVPTFDPSKDELEQYVQKVEMLSDIWPAEKLNELATRLILNTTGAAFQKLQLQRTEILTNDKAGIQKLVTALGGHWGKVTLERKYEIVEKALFRCSQKSDESNDSYLARADIYWTELLSKKMSLEELGSYIVLRGSLLSHEDKKRVILESDASDTGKLSIDKVSQSVRMLGSGFFHEMIGAKKVKGKIYDAANLSVDDPEDASWESTAYMTEEPTEEDMLDALVQEGDEDALLVSEYESAMADTIQEDSELAAAYSLYTDARRRLSERFKNRGFWPTNPAKGKGFGKSFKGKGKGGFKGHRKSLQQRMLETSCRLCGRKGHWKAECPDRPKPAAQGSVAPTLTAIPADPMPNNADDFLPLEFLTLPEIAETSLDEPSMHSGDIPEPRNDAPTDLPAIQSEVSLPTPCPGLATAEPVFFASHETMGILDTGATKSVIGSELIPDLLKGLHDEIRKRVFRCKCSVTFRFGNQGTLESQYALVLPVGKLGLKIAVVQGQTPLLLSNTLLRTLKAQIDVAHHVLHSPLLRKPIALKLSPRGLFLLDVNELAQGASQACVFAETFAHVDESSPRKSESLPVEQHAALQESNNIPVATSSAEAPHEMHDCTATSVEPVNHPTLLNIMSLSKRLGDLRTGSYADPMESFRQMAFQDMCHQKIDFGRAHAGKSYLQVWHQEPAWVKWIVRTYEGSDKLEHKKFLWFIELMVGMEEKGLTPSAILEEHTRASTQMPIPSVAAKAKAKSFPRASPELLASMEAAEAEAAAAEIETEDWMEATMVCNAQSEVIDALQARMMNLEGAMSEILDHIRKAETQ
eukprot:s167_g31.t1